MSTSTLTTAATQQIAATKLGSLNDIVYSGVITYDASPAAVEIYIGGVSGRRLQVPDNTTITGMYSFSAWNITDGTVEDIRMGEFSVENDGGTTAMIPTNLSATDGNPTVRATNGSGTVALAADDTNDALTLDYTGTASKVYHVVMRLYGMVIVGDTVNSNPQQVTTSA